MVTGSTLRGPSGRCFWDCDPCSCRSTDHEREQNLSGTATCGSQTVLPPTTHYASPCQLSLQPTDHELEQHLALIKDSSLRHTLQFGIGLHHAGLPDSDREVVERLYVEGKIQVRSAC